MKVILLESIAKLGQLGDAVEVKPGYARNFLIPKQKAVRATTEAFEEVVRRRARLAQEEKERLDVAQARADTTVRSLKFAKRTIDEEGRLFGSVTISDIIAEAERQGSEILRSEIDMLEGTIKNTGEYTIRVKFHPEVAFDVQVTVVSNEIGTSIEEMIEKSDLSSIEENDSMQALAPESGELVEVEGDDAESNSEKLSS